jgi:hypothetical protein
MLMTGVGRQQVYPVASRPTADRLLPTLAGVDRCRAALGSPLASMTWEVIDTRTRGPDTVAIPTAAERPFE